MLGCGASIGLWPLLPLPGDAEREAARLEGNSETNACNSLLIKITCELCHHVPEDRCVFGDLDDLPTEKQVSGHPEN